MIAIGSALRGRGYDVVISIAEPYAALAQSCGLRAHVVVDNARFQTLLGDPHVWKPIRGVGRIVSWAANEFAPKHLQLIQDNHVAGNTVLVSHPLDFASRIFREFVDVPLTDIHLAPSMLRTFDDPPKMTSSRLEFRRPAWLVRLAYRMVDRIIIDPASAASINRLRRDVGSKINAGREIVRVKRIMDQWWLSPDKILAMYPSWFAPAVRKSFDRVEHCGFPLRDNFTGDSIGGAKQDFKSVAGKTVPLSPGTIVFTSGTAHQHGQSFFRDAVDACQKLGRPGLLLSKHRENLPSDLPVSVTTSSYRPLSEVLPLASAIVHHGGVGTTSAAMAAGCPQIISPMAFDQFDNARHVERLGVGRWLGQRLSGHPQSVVKSLACLLSEPNYRHAAQQMARRLADEGDSIARAAESIDASLHRRNT